jgi:hypothetical protein
MRRGLSIEKVRVEQQREHHWQRGDNGCGPQAVSPGLFGFGAQAAESLRIGPRKAVTWAAGGCL